MSRTEGLAVPAGPEPAVVTTTGGWVAVAPVELFLAAGRGLLDGAARQRSVGAALAALAAGGRPRPGGAPLVGAAGPDRPRTPAGLLQAAAARAGSDHPDVVGPALVELIGLRHPVAPAELNHGSRRGGHHEAEVGGGGVLGAGAPSTSATWCSVRSATSSTVRSRVTQRGDGGDLLVGDAAGHDARRSHRGRARRWWPTRGWSRPRPSRARRWRSPSRPPTQTPEKPATRSPTIRRSASTRRLISSRPRTWSTTRGPSSRQMG